MLISIFILLVLTLTYPNFQGTAQQLGFRFLLQDSDSISAVSLGEVSPPFLHWIQQEAGNPEQAENFHLPRNRETREGVG